MTNKLLIIHTKQEANEHYLSVLDSLDKAVKQLSELCGNSTAITVFSNIKFGAIGLDPLNCRRNLNLIEQVNQSFTYIASFKAVELLFDLHPNHAPFKLNLGTRAGSDIESESGFLAAEVFSATKPNSNQKLKKDIFKVSKTDSNLKYVFLLCPNMIPGKQNLRTEKNVIVWALDFNFH